MHSVEAFCRRTGNVPQGCISFALVASHFVLRRKLGSTNFTECCIPKPSVQEWMIAPPIYFFTRTPSKRKMVGNHGISFGYLHM